MPFDYQGNNPNRKEKPEVPPKVVEKVVTGEVFLKKKSLGKKFKDVFFGGDFKSAARYVAADVLLPALRNMMVDTATKAAERVVYGESRPIRSRHPEYRSYVQYNNPTSPMTPRSQYSQLPDQPRRYAANYRQPNRYDPNQIVIVNRREAEEVVERLVDIIAKYEVASVSDLNELVGQMSNNTDEKWGWTNLNDVEIRQVREGYLIDLPSPEPI